MEHTQAVKEPRVSSTWINEVREPELLDAPKPLKRARLKHAPEYSLHLRSLDVKFDKIMKRVPYALLFRHSGESLIWQRLFEHKTKQEHFNCSALTRP
jgi:hypothetical protein